MKFNKISYKTMTSCRTLDEFVKEEEEEERGLNKNGY